MHLLPKLSQTCRQFPWYVTAALAARRLVALALFTSGVWMLHFLLAGRPLDTVWSDDYLDEAAVTQITVPIEQAGSALVEKRFAHLMSRQVAPQFPELTQTYVDQENREWKLTSLSNTVMRAHVSSQAEKDAAASPPAALSQSALANLSVHTNDGRCLLWDFMPIDRRIPGGICPDDRSIDWIAFYLEWHDGVRVITDFQVSVPLARLLLGLPGKTEPISPLEQPRLDRFVAWLQSEFRQDQAEALAAVGSWTAYPPADLSALASYAAAANLVDRCILYKLAVVPSDSSFTRSGKQGRRLIEAELAQANRDWLRLYEPAIRKHSFQALRLRNERLRRSCLVWLGLAALGLLQFCRRSALGIIAVELQQSRRMRFGRFVRLATAYAPALILPIVSVRFLQQRVAWACEALPNREAVAAIKKEARRVWRCLELGKLPRHRADQLIQAYAWVLAGPASLPSRDFSRKLKLLIEAQEHIKEGTRVSPKITPSLSTNGSIAPPVKMVPNVEPAAVRRQVTEPELDETKVQKILRLTELVPEGMDAILWSLSYTNLDLLERAIPVLGKIGDPRAIQQLLDRGDLRQQLQRNAPVGQAILDGDSFRLAQLLCLQVNNSVTPPPTTQTDELKSGTLLCGIRILCILSEGADREHAFRDALEQLGAEDVRMLNCDRRSELENALYARPQPGLVVMSIANSHTATNLVNSAGLASCRVFIDAVNTGRIRVQLLERIPRSLSGAV